MTRRSFERAVAAVAAGLVAVLALATTLLAAGPLAGPLRDELRWPAPLLVVAAALSLACSVLTFLPACALVRAVSTRPVATCGSLACGLLLFLVLPNLTHVWQLYLVLAALGPARTLVLAPAWSELYSFAGARGAGAGLAVAAGLALLVVTPWIGDVVYRNSWREGAAASGGAMLLLAAPLSFVLLPGREARP